MLDASAQQPNPVRTILRGIILQQDQPDLFESDLDPRLGSQGRNHVPGQVPRIAGAAGQDANLGGILVIPGNQADGDNTFDQFDDTWQADFNL